MSFSCDAASVLPQFLIYIPLSADACVRLLALVAQIAQAWRRAEAEPAPGSPRYDLGALLLRQHRGSPAAAVKRMRLRIGSKKMTPAGRPWPLNIAIAPQPQHSGRARDIRGTYWL